MYKFTEWISISLSKFHNWKKRYGKVNEHNAWVPRDFWLENWEKEAIIDFYTQYPNEGYRRLAFMMLDRNIVAVSPSSVYRVLKGAGLMRKWNRKPSSKGLGFHGPARAHEHWHIDISYLNICGTFYYLCSLLDGYSRYILHWEIRESMQEQDVSIIVQRAREKFPDHRPRIISDNGPQFIAKEFKELIRISGMDQVLTTPYYPQSNGKKERWYQTLKQECIRPKTPLSMEEARKVVADFVHSYNTERLHSAIGYITPETKLNGQEKEVFRQRDQKLAEAREKRKSNRRKAKQKNERADSYNLNGASVSL